jgi:hypothetical protein
LIDRWLAGALPHKGLRGVKLIIGRTEGHSVKRLRPERRPTGRSPPPAPAPSVARCGGETDEALHQRQSSPISAAQKIINLSRIRTTGFTRKLDQRLIIFGPVWGYIIDNLPIDLFEAALGGLSRDPRNRGKIESTYRSVIAH